MSATQINRAIQLLAGQQFGVEMSNSATSEEQKSEDSLRIKKKYEVSLLTALLWFIADAISWTAFLGFHASASLPGAIAFSGVFVMYATFAYTAYGEYKRFFTK